MKSFEHKECLKKNVYLNLFKKIGAANHLILNCCKMMNSDVNINQAESTHSYHQQIKTLQEENRRLNDQVQQLKLKNSMNPIAGENQQQYNSLTGELVKICLSIFKFLGF